MKTNQGHRIIIAGSSVRRIFKGWGGAENLRIMKTKRNKFPLRISPFSCPNLGEEQNKKKVFIQIQNYFPPKIRRKSKNKNKKNETSSLRICPFFFSNFLPWLQRRGSCRNFAFYSMLIILSWRPKGGEGTMTFLNTPIIAGIAIGGGRAPRTPPGYAYDYQETFGYQNVNYFRPSRPIQKLNFFTVCLCFFFHCSFKKNLC